MGLQHWVDLYRERREQALCLDIESDGVAGPITVVGVYRPVDGTPEVRQFVRGKNLDRENLNAVFAGVRLLVTFNGLSWDCKKLEAEFLGLIPKDVPVIDLYRFARLLNLNAGLKVLEQHFNISRDHDFSWRRGLATRLWRRHERFKNEQALRDLLAYNRQDVLNLYPLATALMKVAPKRRERIDHAIKESTCFSRTQIEEAIAESLSVSQQSHRG